MEKIVKKYEINCDMGEGFGRWKMGPDEELMKVVDVANIACGFHAGDPTTMRKMVQLAKKYGVKAGAHPGLQDMFGFGRRKMEIDPADMYAMILYQVGALKAMLDAEGVPLNHVKPHGELFFYMQRDLTIMRAVLEACKVFDVPVYGAQSADEKAMCEELGLIFVEEVYVDIDYSAARKLLPVAQSKQVTPDDVGKRVTSMMRDDSTLDNEGKFLKMGFEGRPFSICIHSDMPTALDNAKAVRKAVDVVNKERGLSG